MHKKIDYSGLDMKNKSERTPPAKRQRTPTVLQMEAVECGAAALSIVLGYHGRFAPLERLRLECGVSRDGSKASNMLKAARKYGLTARGMKVEPDELLSYPFPMIVHWNFNHFLVLEGFRKNQAFLNDPASGPRKVPKEEFDESFTGVALVFEPGPDFSKGGEKPSIVRALKKRFAGSQVALTYVVLAGLALVIPGLVIPIFSKVFIDQVLVKGMQDWFKPLLLGMGITFAMRGVLTWLQERYLLRMETKIALSTASKFFWHILRLPVEFFTQRSSGDIGSRVGLNDTVAQLLSGKLATTVISMMTIIFYAILMFRFDNVLTLVGISMATLNILALRKVARIRKDQNLKLLQDTGKLVGFTMGGVQSIETLKATGSESDFFAKWAGYQAKVMNGFQQLGVVTQSVSVVPPSLQMLTNTAILSIGGLRVMNGDMTMGMLVAFQSLMASFMSPINGMVDLVGNFQQAEGNMNRLDDVHHYQIDKQFDGVETGEKAETTTKLSGHLELKNMTFGYSRLEAPLIENFSLTLKPGGRVALVGGSGSGKSTIARLITGLYEPWSGEILFDGKPREKIARTIINNSLAMVDQTICMFEGSIRENLTIWDSTMPETSIIRAGKDAYIHEDIAARDGGYDHEIQEGGRNFSGGQRQRMEIARALAANPTLLVLDEATSALDATTEKIIDDNLRRRGCTCVIVAHRLSTIRDCDEIIVLEKGKVIQRGTHDEMKDSEGAYAELIKAH